MKLTYHTFTKDLAKNREILSQGLTDPHCVYAGATLPHHKKIVVEKMPKGMIYGSAEEYGDGALNVFVRDWKQAVVGVITARRW